MRLLDATAPELRRGWGKHELEGIFPHLRSYLSGKGLGRTRAHMGCVAAPKRNAELIQH